MHPQFLLLLLLSPFYFILQESEIKAEQWQIDA